MNPAGTVVYVTNWEANVGVQHDSVTGALTVLAGSPFTANTSGWGWQSVAVNPAGTFAYVGGGNGTQLLTFSIDPTTGALTQLPTESYGTVGSNYVVFDSTGSTAIISNAWVLSVWVASSIRPLAK